LADFCKLQLLIREIIGDPPAKQFLIIFPGFEKSSERMTPPLEVIITLEYSLTWGKSISTFLSCQGKITGTAEALMVSNQVAKGKMGLMRDGES
jgi:hypothetical protein